VTAATSATRPIRIGISACLLGEQVRFDGGHKHDPSLANMFGSLVEWVPVCPEVEAGFGTPREPMRLVRRDNEIRVLTVNTALDVTAQLVDYSTRRVAELSAEDLSGYVLKASSPSCGIDGVKLYGPSGALTLTGRGVYAARLRERFPDLPIEDEEHLSDLGVREDFVARVFAYWRLKGEDS
jgi:uncharacterized protein YbbK (DUF523 family)